jgi:anti-sigma factor RsiW
MLLIEPGGITMKHEEAVQQLAIERYLLDELTPELREQFEEHLFDCQ